MDVERVQLMEHGGSNPNYIITFELEYPSNGLCPRLHISYMRQPKLHTSLAVEYFLKWRAYSIEQSSQLQYNYRSPNLLYSLQELST